MGSSGNITTFIDFHDVINSEPLNQRFINRFATGIYFGADLGIVSNTVVSVSAFDIEFSDGTARMKATSSGSNNVTVSNINVWVVARWSYTGTANDIPTLVGVSSTLTNDIILGQCVFAGSTLNGFNLASRSDAVNFNKFCFVEPTGVASMQVKVRAGNVANGTTTFFIPEQLTSTITAPVSNPRIDVVTVNSSGSVVIIKGTENVSPSAPSSSGNIPLAQITLQTASTSIVSSMITDARAFLNTTPSTAVTITINQVAHGFTVGQPLTLTGTGFVLAKADTQADATVVGIVSTVLDSNDFILTLDGWVPGLSGVTIGTLYYLSGTSAGSITSTNPATSGYLSVPVLFADSSTSGYFLRNNPVGSLVGTRLNLSANTPYLAATDGFASVSIDNGGAGEVNIQIGSSNPPLTIVAVAGCAAQPNDRGFAAALVAKGEWYEFVTGSSPNINYCNFRPFGS